MKASPNTLVAPTSTKIKLKVKERLLSVSGEDFDVFDNETGKKVYSIVGSNKVPFGVGGLVLDKVRCSEWQSDKLRELFSNSDLRVALILIFEL